MPCFTDLRDNIQRRDPYEVALLHRPQLTYLYRELAEIYQLSAALVLVHV